jgi:hypothetical protein
MTFWLKAGLGVSTQNDGHALAKEPEVTEDFWAFLSTWGG